MNLDQQFMAAVIEAHDAHGSGIQVLPTLLTQACVAVLGVTGAGISMIDEELRSCTSPSGQVRRRLRSRSPEIDVPGRG